MQPTSSYMSIAARPRGCRYEHIRRESLMSRKTMRNAAKKAAREQRPAAARSTPLSILNVGDGDTKISFDKDKPAERKRACRIVTDMLHRGYAILVQAGEKD